MKIAVYADFHGRLPEVDSLFPCDVMLIGGDIVIGRGGVLARSWMDSNFKGWLEDIKSLRKDICHVIGIAGNHDFLFQEDMSFINRLKLSWTYLCDSEVIIDGVKIYGTPWQPWFFDWAFNLDRPSNLSSISEIEPQLTEKFAMIPDDTDILLTHSPPHGILDRNQSGSPCGSYALLQRVMDIKPVLHVFGHIHEARGVDHCQHENGESTIFVNASTISRSMRQYFDGMVFDI